MSAHSLKTYLALKYHLDVSNRPLIEVLAACLESNGFETFCVFRDLEDWARVRYSPGDLVVVELSEKGVGIGIEAGYAFARQIPVVTLARQGADISDTLRGISAQVFAYANWPDVGTFFRTLPRSLSCAETAGRRQP